MRQFSVKGYLGCAALAALLTAGCNKKEETPNRQGEPVMPGGIPPLEPSAPGAAGTRPSGALPPGHPPIGAEGGGMAGTTGPVDPTQFVSGVIQISAKLKSTLGPTDVLFLSVRQDQGGNPGQILAVDRLDAKQFPVPFAIDGRKAMVPGTQLAGPVMVTARIDRDGDAMTKQPGDLQGVAKAKIPAKHVVVNIDTKLE